MQVSRWGKYTQCFKYVTHTLWFVTLNVIKKNLLCPIVSQLDHHKLYTIYILNNDIIQYLSMVPDGVMQYRDISTRGH